MSCYFMYSYENEINIRQAAYLLLRHLRALLICITLAVNDDSLAATTTVPHASIAADVYTTIVGPGTATSVVTALVLKSSGAADAGTTAVGSGTATSVVINLHLKSSGAADVGTTAVCPGTATSVVIALVLKSSGATNFVKSIVIATTYNTHQGKICNANKLTKIVSYQLQASSQARGC